MANNIILKCKECAHKKTLNPEAVLALAEKHGLVVSDSEDLINSRLNFCCSKCGSKKFIIFDEGAANTEENRAQKEMVQCSYDGTMYQKGTLCPNFASHQDVRTHRNKRKANDMYSRHRGE